MTRKLKVGSFDDLIDAGARYVEPRRHAEPKIQLDGIEILDTPDDLIVLENVIATPHCGLIWRDFWLSEAIEYIGPDWKTAPWIPGIYDPETDTIEIENENLQPNSMFEGCLFWIDSLNGHRTYGHFIHDTLPYGTLYQEVRREFRQAKPLLRPLQFNNMQRIFESVFQIGYSDCIPFSSVAPTAIKQLILARRQTNFSVPDVWTTSFPGLRHIRTAGLEMLGERGLLYPASEDCRIYLHRHQDPAIADRMATQGRNYDNIPDLTMFLIDRGFVAIEPSRVPLELEMALLLKAHCAIGPHGANMADVVFCAPGTHILEIQSGDGCWRSLEAMCAVLGHNFRALIQERPIPSCAPSISLDRVGDALAAVYKGRYISESIDRDFFVTRQFRFSRTDGTTIAPSVSFEDGGAITGYFSDNESSWEIEGINLVFRNSKGQITTIFDRPFIFQGHHYFLGRFLPSRDRWELRQHLLVETNQPNVS